jgi:hypothetical protein
MNWEKLRRKKGSDPVLKYHPVILREGQRGKNLSLQPVSNEVPPE